MEKATLCPVVTVVIAGKVLKFEYPPKIDPGPGAAVAQAFAFA
jgi:hypothetical protein